MIKKIYGNSSVELRNLLDNSFNLCITSPPYKNADGYSPALMHSVFTQLYRVLDAGSLFFLNFGHLANDKFRPFATCKIAMDVGFKLNDTIVWSKNHYTPLQGNRRLNNLTEFIFLLYKRKWITLLYAMASCQPY